jgi:hypothetical protein
MILDRRQRGKPRSHAPGCILAVFLLVSVTAPVLAQVPAPPGEGTGVLSLKSEPAGAVVELRGEHRWRGMTPCDFNRGLKGRYEVTARMPLYESWHRTLDLSETESRELNIRLTPKSSWKAGMRSVLVPGWGQFYAEEPVKGGVFLGATALAAGGLLWTHLIYRNEADDYLEARDRYFRSTHSEDLPALRARMMKKDREAQDAYDLRKGFLIATGACYAVAFIDAAFFFPSRSEGTFATLRPFGEKGPDLALRPTRSGSLELAVVLRRSNGGAR